MKGNLKAVLANKIEPKQLKQLYKTYDIVGDIAVFRIPEQLQQHSKTVAETIMQTHSQVESVWRQVSSVSGDYRLRGLEHVLGKKTTQTVYKEYGCIYKVNLKTAYFSPRLSYERLRIAKLVKPQEVVLNMFSGVGCYSIAVAKHSEPKKVYSIDINPEAFEYLQENIRLNRVDTVVVPIQADSKAVKENGLEAVADRVLMPLPERAYEYLDYAVLALKPDGGWIHYYDFEYANKRQNPIKKAETKVINKLENICCKFEINLGRIVRTIGPNWHQIVLDIQVQK